MSKIYVDEIAGIASPSTVAIPGHVIQVVQATKTDTQTIQNTTFTDVSDLSVSITPSSTSSKILVLMHMHHGSVGGIGSFRLVRGATAIHVGDASSLRIQATGGLGYGVSSENSGAYYGGLVSAAQYLDLPSTTSATTYKVQVSERNNAPIVINRAGYDVDGVNGIRGTSSITLMEIAG